MINDWHVIIHSHLPAYITWSKFQENQKRLTENSYLMKTKGAARNGKALLAGLVYCVKCARRLTVQYAVDGRVVYICQSRASDYGEPVCQSFSGASLDDLIHHEILKVIAPSSLQLSMNRRQILRAKERI